MTNTTETPSLAREQRMTRYTLARQLAKGERHMSTFDVLDLAVMACYGELSGHLTLTNAI